MYVQYSVLTTVGAVVPWLTAVPWLMAICWLVDVITFLKFSVDGDSAYAIPELKK